MGFIHTILNTPEKDPGHWYREGKDLSSRGYYLDALEALDRMLAIDPLHADSWLLKGYALYQMGKYEEGLQFF
ncbi:MAG: hypothetical protein Q8R70_02380, partial [Methanoregula sp.]|nr:hypothetical protein [Methanoregula sp.]